MALGSHMAIKKINFAYLNFLLNARKHIYYATYTSESIYPTQLSSKTEYNVATSSNCQVEPTKGSADLCYKTCAPKTEKKKSSNGHSPAVAIAGTFSTFSERKYHGSEEIPEDLLRR